MAFKVIKTNIPDLLVLEPSVFEDNRGFFLEAFNQRDFNIAVGRNVQFLQDNHSRSKKGVLRGLHYQIEKPQGKLVRVSSGAVFDVAVDIRKDSNTFGKWFGIELSDTNHRQLWIPEGFAHGFYVLSERADFIYKVTDFYHPELEMGIRWDCEKLAINWPLDGLPEISEKDKNFSQFNSSPVVP